MALDAVEPSFEIAADLAAIERIPFAEDGRQITAQLGDPLFVGFHQQHAETGVNAEAADQPSPLADPAVMLQQAELLQALLSLPHGCCGGRIQPGQLFPQPSSPLGQFHQHGLGICQQQFRGVKGGAPLLLCR